MKFNCIELSIRDKKGKKKYCESIFMPKFLLNVINLTKKAEKLRKMKKSSKITQGVPTWVHLESKI